MSELHPDADLVKVTRTTTTYEPADNRSKPVPFRQRHGSLLWVAAIVVMVAIVLGILYYMNTAAGQARAQSLSQQAAASQQGAQAAQPSSTSTAK
jgi:flagellar biosynthesis/type III secretory pathway M-ring protein FliF/YscJ